MLKTWRFQPILPHRFAASLREMLLWQEALFIAIADQLDDERWRAAARALHDAAEAVRRIT